jgi:hypothetical protein
MKIDQDVKELDGKILLLDNKKFVYCVSFIGLYYVAFIVFLAHTIVQSGGFHQSYRTHYSSYTHRIHSGHYRDLQAG